MIRFIDLRGQYYLDHREPKEKQQTIFAFLNTITDQFIIYDGNSVWGTFEELEEWVEGDTECPLDMERLKGLVPEEFLR